MKNYKTIALAATLLALAAASLALAGSREAWLGVYTQGVDPDLAEAFGLAVDRGAIINDIVEDSPAEKAGLEEDDIIIKFNGDRVRDDDDLIDLVADANPGDKVELTVVRDGTEMTIEAELDSRPRSYYRRHSNWGWFDAPRAPKAPHAPRVPAIPRIPGFYFDDHGERAYIGVSLVELSDRAIENLGAGDHGVMIDNVERKSPAEKAGLKPGDIIVAVNGEEVFESEDVQDIVWDLEEGDIAKIEIVRERDRSTVEVAVEIDEDAGFYGRHRTIRIPDLPDIDIDLRGMRGLRYGNSHDRLFDSDEFEAEMEDLQDELKDLQKELRDLKKSLE